MPFIHKNLAAGGWSELSLMEQLGNVGTEVERAARAEGKDPKLFQGAVVRTLELFDLTLTDPRWQGRYREIARAREVFCDAVLGGKEYGSLLSDLDSYFLPFALVARRKMLEL